MTKTLLRPVLAALVLAAATVSAQAETELLYQCGGTDLNVVVTTYPESGRGRFDGAFAADLVPDGQGAWVNAAHEVQFWPEGDGPILYIGVEQFSCVAFEDDPGMNAGAEPADDGAAIPNTADLDMAPYGSARGWDVLSLNSGADFVGCAGSTDLPPGFLILQKKDYGWELRVPADKTEGFEGGVIVVDGKTVDAQFGFTPEGAAEAGMSDDLVAALAQGTKLTTQINGTKPVNWPLSGSAAVVTKIEECFTRKGVAP